MSIKNTIRALPLQSVDSDELSDTYILLGTLDLPCYLLRIQNSSDMDVTLSYDGETDHEFCPSGYKGSFDLYAPTVTGVYIPLFPEGMTVYVKGSKGEYGSIYLSAYYHPLGK